MGRNSLATLLPVFSITSCSFGLAHTALGVGLGERKCGVANGSIQNALLGGFYTEFFENALIVGFSGTMATGIFFR